MSLEKRVNDLQFGLIRILSDFSYGPLIIDGIKVPRSGVGDHCLDFKHANLVVYGLGLY